jgi:DNA-binding Lrp family transcriptional regulator
MQHARAYVLIEAEAGQVGSVIATLRDIPGVSMADPVTGPYDIVVTIETPDPRDIGRLVMNEIHGVNGIKRTVTCLAI